MTRDRSMVQFSSLLNGLTMTKGNSSNVKKKKTRGDVGVGRGVAAALVKDARKNGLLLTTSSPGTIDASWSDNYASAHSKGGKKGVNQDRFLVWEAFGGQQDMILCCIFDGHGPWGHLVARRVKKVMPAYLLHYYRQETNQEAQTPSPTLSSSSSSSPSSLVMVNETHDDANINTNPSFDINVWKGSFFKACATVDDDLEQHPRIDSFHSGTTALTLIRQDDHIVLANVGDSRAVLGATSDDGSLVAIQLTVDLKPNLPQETVRIKRSNGRVYESNDEPGVSRIWKSTTPGEGPGLALSRAFGDFFIKDFGLISEPEVTYRNISSTDHFVILASDGLWDVVPNEKAVEIVYSTPEREESAKRLVDYAADQWKQKRRGLAMDDISVICLFFHKSAS